MSAPEPPTPFPLPKRLLRAGAFALVGFVGVWLGFGLAGFGTDVHLSRAAPALAALFVCGLLVARPNTRPAVRLVAALVGLGAAGYAWWEVPNSHLKSAMSLRNAVRTRDWYRERFAVPTAEEAEKTEGLRGVKWLVEQYPSLAQDVPAEYDRWATATADGIIARYARLGPDDFQASGALVKPAKALADAHPASAERLDAARRQWATDAIRTKTDELRNLAPGAWNTFNDTAPGRRALVEAVPDSRDAVLQAEDEWVDASVETLVTKGLGPKAGDPPPREFWNKISRDVLALNALDGSDRRLARARGRLFKAAHDSVRAAALAHFEAGHADRAFGLARTHAVEWSATAAVLGAGEQQALTELRAAYEFFAVLESKTVRAPERAPPPRTKP